MSGSRVIHSDDLPWEEGGQGDLFAHRRRRLGLAAGGDQLGCSMMELDPGKTAWPFHYHRANEEALYVLAGEAMLRLGSERLRVRAGDYVALPTGPDDAHQLTNTGSEIVRYLVISTMTTPDVCVYPDAGKVGVVGALTDDDGAMRRVVTFPLAAEVGYWDGETTELEGSAPKADEVEDTARRAARQAELDDRVEADLEALRRKVEREGGAKARTPPPRPEAEASASEAPDPAPDPVEAELEALRRKVASEGGSARASASADTTTTSPSDEPGDASIDELKRSLDGD